MILTADPKRHIGHGDPKVNITAGGRPIVGQGGARPAINSVLKKWLARHQTKPPCQSFLNIRQIRSVDGYQERKGICKLMIDCAD